ncbi:MAG: TrkA family potassium uptake protein, partial [Oscillospiraceae bacterium]|nr:TrkA family potassium uptake protein [Oscillospiraceae bacterium]
MKSYIVVGLGRFGSQVARQLYSLGCEVLAMDLSAELVQQISNDVTHAVVGDAQDKEVLKALGVRNLDCA